MKKTKLWEKYCAILRFVKAKYGEQKAESPGLVCDFKMSETLTNDALELLGFPHVTFVWGNMIYPKTKLTQRECTTTEKLYT